MTTHDIVAPSISLPQHAQSRNGKRVDALERDLLSTEETPAGGEGGGGRVLHFDSLRLGFTCLMPAGSLNTVEFLSLFLCTGILVVQNTERRMVGKEIREETRLSNFAFSRISVLWIQTKVQQGENRIREARQTWFAGN